jgi:hypothetical protein
MKIIIKVFFVAAALIFISNANEIQAQANLRITNPTCCPSQGNCGAVHPVIGPANPQQFNGNGIFNVFLFWNTTFLPGVYDTFFWAKTITVQVPNAAYDAMYCCDEDTCPIGYNHNLTCELSLSPVYIYEIEDPD